MVSRCETCEKEFSSDQGLLQHYSDKHPKVSPPQDVRKRESRRIKSRAGSNNNRNQLEKRKRTLVVAGIVALILILAMASAFYFSYGQHAVQNTTTIGSIPTTNVVFGIKDGNKAPDFPITFVNGTTVNLSGLSGHSVLLWFVTTWCTSCQQGGQMLTQQYYEQLYSKGVVIVTVELYNDLGQSGPSIQQFASQYGGGGSGKPGWFYAISNQNTTYTYDPQSDLDIFYLINTQGVIVMSGVGLPNYLPNVVNAA